MIDDFFFKEGVEIIKADPFSSQQPSDTESVGQVPLYRAVPEVTILSPSGQVNVTQGANLYSGYIDITGEVMDVLAWATDNPASSGPQVMVNGEPASVSYQGNDKYSFQVSIPVQAGLNAIDVEATNAIGNIGSNTIYVSVTASSGFNGFSGGPTLVGQVQLGGKTDSETTFIGRAQVIDKQFSGDSMPVTITTYDAGGSVIKSIDLDLQKDTDGVWRSPYLVIAEQYDQPDFANANIARFLEVPVGGKIVLRRESDTKSDRSKKVSGLAFLPDEIDALQSSDNARIDLKFPNTKKDTLKVQINRPSGDQEDWTSAFSTSDDAASLMGGSLDYGSTDIFVQIADKEGNVFKRKTSAFRYNPLNLDDITTQRDRNLKSVVPVVLSEQNGFNPHLEGVTTLQFPSAMSDAAKSELLSRARLEILAYAPDRSMAYVRSHEGISALSTSQRLQRSFAAKVYEGTSSALEYAGAITWGFVSGGLDGAKGLAIGVGRAGKTIVMEPLYVVDDDLVTGYIMAFEPEWGDYYEPMSGVRKAVEAGYEPGEILYQAGVGVAQTPQRFVQALVDVDSDKIGEEYVNLAALLLPFKGANLSFPAKTIGYLPVGQRMTTSGSMVMEYAAVTIRTVEINGVEIAKGTLIAMSEVTGNLGGSGGLAGGDPNEITDLKEVTSPDTPDDYEIWINENKGLIANLDDEAMIQFKINTLGTGVRGTDLFKRMMNHFGDRAKGVWGKWVAGTNLEELNNLTAGGMPLEDAVSLTWTGKRARDFGFTKAVVFSSEGTPGAYTNVAVKFTRP